MSADAEQPTLDEAADQKIAVPDTAVVERLEDRAQEQADELALLKVSGDTELDEVKRLAVVMYHAGYFAANPTGKGGGDLKGSQTQQIAQAIVKILAGREIGLGPLASMMGVYVTKEGRVAYMSNLIAQAIKGSDRYDYRVTEISDERCVIEFRERTVGGSWDAVEPDGTRTTLRREHVGQFLPQGVRLESAPRDWDSLGTSEFTIEDARRAGLLDKDNWKRYPRSMLFARALTAGARWYTPDLFDGPAYTPDELDEQPPLDIVDAELMQQEGTS